jgi:LuxR family maltose regulon positive regulatory protein
MIERLFGTITHPCLVVFDDYHIPAASPALRLVTKALLETTPSSVRFLLLSRTRPELDIAKLRARRAMAELKGSDLMFSDREAQELFGSAFGMPLAPREASLINRAAEGWAAGLVLMHEYLASAPADGRLETLRGRPRTECSTPIFDYLAQEVFLNLPEGLQDFLLRTSVADELTAPLLSLLSGLPESAPGSRPSVAARVAYEGSLVSM